MQNSYIIQDLDYALMLFDFMIKNKDSYTQGTIDILLDIKTLVDDIKDTKRVSTVVASLLVDDILQLHKELEIHLD